MDKFLSISLKNIAWFNDINTAGQLNMKPSYQRNIVWTDRQKSYLIDSILNGYPIPEIYIQEEIDENGNSNYIIVDGQQRMRAVLEFLDDQYSLNKEDSPEFNGAYFKDLEPDQKRAFFRYNFVVRTLPELAEDDIREIFKRLNRNVMNLNKQELRNAVYSGPLIRMVTEIAENDVWGELRLFTANDVRRMLDEEYISELVLAQVYGIQNKKVNLDKFFEETEVEFPQEEEIRAIFTQILNELAPIANTLSRSRWKNKTDFYTLFNTLVRYKSHLPLTTDRQNMLRDKLLSFSEEVMRFMSLDQANEEEFPQNIVKYAKGVRAATDLNARKSRQESLDEYLSDVFE